MLSIPDTFCTYAGRDEYEQFHLEMAYRNFGFFQFDQSGLFYSQRFFYLGNDSDKYRDAEIAYIKAVASWLGASEVDLFQAEEIYDFELAIARVSTI